MPHKTIDPQHNVDEFLILQDVAEKGRGVFAVKNFSTGEFVLEFLGERVDRDEIADLKHALQIGPRLFLTASGLIDDYVNHSCHPNTGIRDDEAGRIFLFALRPIKAGEEITFDYATTQSNRFSSMDCECGSLQCRKKIADWDDLPQNLKKYYLTNDAVLTFLKKGEASDPHLSFDKETSTDL